MYHRLLASLFLLLSLAAADVSIIQRDTLSTSVSGTVLQFNDNVASVTNSFEIKITGAPATISVVTTGCGRGGTCSSALDTYTTVANAVRTITGGPYDYFNVTVSWTGGTNPSVLINRTGVAAAGASTGGSSVTVVGPLGQAAMAASVPVVLASNQSNVPENLAQVNGNTISTAASGTQKVGIVGNAGATVDGTVAAGAAPTNGFPALAVYNTTPPTLTNGQSVANQADAAGAVRINTTGLRPTYRASVALLVTATSATDVFTITGSASKTIHVLSVSVNGSGTAIEVPVSLVVHSTVDSGGTSGSAAAVPLDSNSAAATATCLSYTANPTIGNVVGTPVDIQTANINATSGGNPDFLLMTFGRFAGQDLVLRGTSQQLAVNFNSTTITTPKINIVVEWVESND